MAQSHDLLCPAKQSMENRCACEILSQAEDRGYNMGRAAAAAAVMNVFSVKENPKMDEAVYAARGF